MALTKVLVVEDDNDIRNAYVFALMQAGFQVAQSSDGGEAISALDRDVPDVIVLDMLMPGVSGLDFLRQTGITTKYPKTKIVALSNIETPRVREQAQQLGVAEYIIKVNTTPHQMVDIVRKYAAMSPPPGAAPAAGSAPATPPKA